LDARGRTCRGLIEAWSVKNAREILARQGILAERVRPAPGTPRFRPEARAVVYREMASLLGAGLPLVRALDVLIDAPETGDVRPLLANVRDRVKEGRSLSDALRRVSSAVTPFEGAMVEAGERSATVEPMLIRLADFMDEQRAIRERVQSALIYPAIVLTLGICVAIVMLGLLLPRAEGILAAGRMEPPALTRWMLAVGRGAVRWAPWAAGLAVAVAVALRWMGRRDPSVREAWHRLLFRIPLFGRAYGELVSARFARTLSVLLRGGVPAVEAVTLAGRATGNAWDERRTIEAADAVRHGARLSDALRDVPGLGPSLGGWVGVGETSGDLAGVLDGAGNRCLGAWTRFTDRSLRVLEPVLVVLIGGFVLLVTLSVLLPVLRLSRAVG
jgi:general secretion pathway protein F